MRYVLCCLMFAILPMLQAGGGPEAVALIVNANDEASKEIANYYAHLRQIPEINVIYLDQVPAMNTISLEVFRKQILLPIFAQIKQRGLDKQIDYITYSCGFPTRVQFDRAHAQKMPYIANPFASLTGMTYLFQISLGDDKAFLAPRTNLYFRQTRFETGVKGKIESAPRESLTEVYAFFNEKNQRDRKRKKEKQEKSDVDKEWEEAQWKITLTKLQEICKTYPLDPSLWYNRACAEAMNNNTDDAIDALSTAVNAGHVDWQHTQNDGDLKSLREHDAFKKLINRMKNIDVTVADSIGFSAQYGFNKAGAIVPSNQGMHYVISTMLGYTGERGNSIDEIKSYLKRAASADGTQPKGHIYFPLNGDIRSRTREWAVRSVVKQLNEIGVQASHLRGTIPHGKTDVLGATVGIATFNLEKSKTTLLPGAICEHLTSWGAEFERNGQTKISAWLRGGAAGSSGTISEPYALQFKFPNAFIHLHYARGCSLGEAFYQSIESPYELLIVGDALCQPWAQRQSLKPSGLPENKTVTESIDLSLAHAQNIKGYVAMLNGRIIGKAATGESLTLDPTIATPGHYELRLIAIDNTPIQTRSSHIEQIHIGSERLFTKHSISETDNQIRVEFNSKNDERFAACVLMQYGRIIARHANSNGHFLVDRKKVGNGALQLRLALLGEDQKVFYLGPQLSLAD